MKKKRTKISQVISARKKPSHRDAIHIETILGGSDKPTLPMVGIEVEMERAEFNLSGHIPDYLAYPDSDGSLKEAGLEVITKPLYPKACDTFLDFLDKLHKAKPEINYSHRCSIHVHVDVTNIPYNNLPVLVASYICFENLFFSLVDPDRKRNPYCIPFADYAPTKNTLNPDLFGGDTHKYFAFNLSTIPKYNTIEFRHSEGHKDIKRLKYWVSLCRDFVNFFINADASIIRKRILELNSVSNYENFIIEVFGRNPFPFLDYRELMAENVTIAKGVL